jgi:hypothetical protein
VQNYKAAKLQKKTFLRQKRFAAPILLVPPQNCKAATPPNDFLQLCSVADLCRHFKVTFVHTLEFRSAEFSLFAALQIKTHTRSNLESNIFFGASDTFEDSIQI